MTAEHLVVVHAAIQIVATADGEPDEGLWAAIGVRFGGGEVRVVAGQGPSKLAAEEDARAKAEAAP